MKLLRAAQGYVDEDDGSKLDDHADLRSEFPESADITRQPFPGVYPRSRIPISQQPNPPSGGPADNVEGTASRAHQPMCTAHAGRRDVAAGAISAVRIILAARMDQMRREGGACYQRLLQVQRQLEYQRALLGLDGEKLKLRHPPLAGGSNRKWLACAAGNAGSKNRYAHPQIPDGRLPSRAQPADWEGSEFKVRMLGTLRDKLRMKLALQALAHHRAATRDRRRLLQLLEDREAQVRCRAVLRALFAHAEPAFAAINKSDFLASILARQRDRHRLKTWRQWAHDKVLRRQLVRVGAIAARRIKLIAAFAHWATFVRAGRVHSMQSTLALQWRSTWVTLKALTGWRLFTHRMQAINAGLSKSKRQQPAPPSLEDAHSHMRHSFAGQRQAVAVPVAELHHLQRYLRFAASAEDVDWAAAGSNTAVGAYRQARSRLQAEARAARADGDSPVAPGAVPMAPVPARSVLHLGKWPGVMQARRLQAEVQFRQEQLEQAARALIEHKQEADAHHAAAEKHAKEVEAQASEVAQAAKDTNERAMEAAAKLVLLEQEQARLEAEEAAEEASLGIALTAADPSVPIDERGADEAVTPDAAHWIIAQEELVAAEKVKSAAAQAVQVATQALAESLEDSASLQAAAQESQAAAQAMANQQAQAQADLQQCRQKRAAAVNTFRDLVQKVEDMKAAFDSTDEAGRTELAPQVAEAADALTEARQQVELLDKEAAEAAVQAEHAVEDAAAAQQQASALQAALEASAAQEVALQQQAEQAAQAFTDAERALVQAAAQQAQQRQHAQQTQQDEEAEKLEQQRLAALQASQQAHEDFAQADANELAQIEAERALRAFKANHALRAEQAARAGELSGPGQLRRCLRLWASETRDTSDWLALHRGRVLRAGALAQWVRWMQARAVMLTQTISAAAAHRLHVLRPAFRALRAYAAAKAQQREQIRRCRTQKLRSLLVYWHKWAHTCRHLKQLLDRSLLDGRRNRVKDAFCHWAWLTRSKALLGRVFGVAEQLWDQYDAHLREYEVVQRALVCWATRARAKARRRHELKRAGAANTFRRARLLIVAFQALEANACAAKDAERLLKTRNRLFTAWACYVASVAPPAGSAAAAGVAASASLAVVRRKLRQQGFATEQQYRELWERRQLLGAGMRAFARTIKQPCWHYQQGLMRRALQGMRDQTAVTGRALGSFWLQWRIRKPLHRGFKAWQGKGSAATSHVLAAACRFQQPCQPCGGGPKAEDGCRNV
ncbi:hypothetical protein WJX72_009824 [[Myrmecia] bisecta]|uniref:Uncharacterized protein n=1 Tax=[Myrmecia] bisecta TaxID=41462 RepID=A0AAW1PUF0_9CHLO